MRDFLNMEKRLSKLSGKFLFKKNKNLNNQEGSAIIIALLVMVLLLGFVAFAVSRTSNETITASNDVEETKTFEAGQASLEIMTHNFNKIFDYKLSPSDADLHGTNGVEKKFPTDFTGEYDFEQKIDQTRDAEEVVMTGQQFQGLRALRDEWQIDTTATDKNSGVQVALRRRFFNNLIPIFQFGIFYEDDLEFHPGPKFAFGGRVHSNRHIYMKSGNLLKFTSKVTAAGQILTDVMRNGDSSGTYTDKIKIQNAAGTFVSLNNDMGSALRDTVNGSPVINQADMPVAYRNANWKANEVLFQGNLLAEQAELELPLRKASKLAGNPLDYIEIIKRGKAVGDLLNASNPVTTGTADSVITAQERYYNKTGIRISLADSKAKLPGCASGIGTGATANDCGIRLDGDSSGDGSEPGSGARGYKPRKMGTEYQATTLNGERFYRGSGTETWIKIETVEWNESTNTVKTVDITQDILALGMTEAASAIYDGGYKFAIYDGTTDYYLKNIDQRSIFKLQRFIFGDGVVDSSSAFITDKSWNGKNYNFVVASASVGSVDDGTFGDFSGDNTAHMKAAYIDGFTDAKIVPFPIKMFDAREGIYNDNMNTSSFGSNKVPAAGVLSMVDIDVANLRKFLNGDFDSEMPADTPFFTANARKFKATDIPESNGWVLYISDRRGDKDFDGEYDMEDIYGSTATFGNDGIKQYGEDVNDDGFLQMDYGSGGEAVKYSVGVFKGIAATLEHRYYRRGIRLINGQTLPGIYDTATPANTRGFTAASENGVYTLGNYNATGISSVGEPTTSEEYLPQDQPTHIPASIAADAVTILSNKWTDAGSFKNAFNLNGRVPNETTVRFAMISGDTRSSLIETGEPDQGGTDMQLAGGVHNFKRFLEKWDGIRVNYAGSLINLYNSRNSNAAFKCCVKVYGAPNRNWVFDETFLNPTRLPPGTPYFQTIQLTGFQRVN